MNRDTWLGGLAAVTLAASLAACASPSAGGAGADSRPGEGVSVRMAQATWDTGWFQAQVVSQLLAELGYEVGAPETLDPVAFYHFAGQGDMDFWANGWFPNHSRYLEYDDVAGKVAPVGFLIEAGALQGYLIDSASADEYGITNLGDLADPDIAAVFDADGDGKADLIGCDAGWGCAKMIDHQLKAYELLDTVEHVQGDYSALVTEAIARYETGEPILLYNWTPNWTVSELVVGEDVAWLGVPFSSLPDEPDADTATESVPGCLETPCDMGFGVADIRIVANEEFLKANPPAAELFALLEIPLDDVAAQNARFAAGENSDEDVRRHAAEWIEANRNRVDEWLATARSAGS